MVLPRGQCSLRARSAWSQHPRPRSQSGRPLGADAHRGRADHRLFQRRHARLAGHLGARLRTAPRLRVRPHQAGRHAVSPNRQHLDRHLQPHGECRGCALARADGRHDLGSRSSPSANCIRPRRFWSNSRIPSATASTRPGRASRRGCSRNCSWEAGVRVDGLALRLVMGDRTLGRARRDLLTIAHTLDSFAVLERPIHISALGVPSMTPASMPPSDPPLSPQAQAEWTQQLLEVIAARPYIRSAVLAGLADLDAPAYLAHGGLLDRVDALLIAALALLAVTVWLRTRGRSVWFTLGPTVFMLVMTLWSLGVTIHQHLGRLAAGPDRGSPRRGV
ncbi:MAG: hypothetical protein HC927_01815, partial [Deltaproteobacteria bacterium]|nr:hypothetical protein [Deltaproteobacteria bacterium]